MVPSLVLAGPCSWPARGDQASVGQTCESQGGIKVAPRGKFSETTCSLCYGLNCIP